MGGLAIVTCLFVLFGRRTPRAHRIVGGVLVALLVGTAFAAAAALPDDGRIDNWVYARYTSYLVPAAFVTGAAVVCRAGRRRLAAAAAGAAGLTLLLAELVMWSAGPLLRTQVFISWGMPDVLFLAADWGKLNMLRSTSAALVVLGATVLLRLTGGRRVAWALGLSLAMFAGFATATVTEAVAHPHSKWRKGLATGFTQSSGLRPDDSVVFAWDVDGFLRGTQAFEVYQGRIWYRDPRWQPLPAEATAMITPAPAEDAAPDGYWSGHPAEWRVEKVDRQQNFTVWRRG